MAILQMQRIEICSLKKYRKEILEMLQRKGVVQVEDVTVEDSVFSKLDTSSQQQLYQKNAALAGQAGQILEQYLPAQKSPLKFLEGRKSLSEGDYYLFVEESSEIMRIAYSLISEQKAITDAQADVVKYQMQIDALTPWEPLDVSMRFQGTSSTAAFIGILPELWDEASVKLKLAELFPEADGVEAEIISATEDQTCLFLICRKMDEEGVFSALRQMGFAKPSFNSKETPKQRIKELESRIEALQQETEEHIRQIKNLDGTQNALAFMEDYWMMRAEKYKIIQNLILSRHVFFMSGYVTKKDGAELAKILSARYDAEVELADASDDSVPVSLKNNAFTEPVESVLATYSYPRHSEMDPTAIMAVFYYVFFGMMFSDAGYGLVMSLGCGWALKKFKNMELGLRKTVKMFFYCGLSTIFWGLMFGSFFGDAFSVICQTFLRMDASAVPRIPGISAPMWFNPVSDPMRLLMVAFLFGIIHIFVGLGIQGYMHIRDGRFLDAVYDVLSWYLLVGGGILALLSLDMMKDIAGFILPSYFLTIGGICAGIGAVIILLFAGRSSRHPVKRFLKGAYGLYGASGYLSDILSYSRLLALGLATGVIAQVFNQIGSMFGSNIFAMILFTVVFLIGHTLNIGINALGAYVHTNRLQFVEFFGKFYEGGGEEFKPFKMNTKHFIVKEDINHG